MVGPAEIDKRQVAIKRLKEKSEFHIHLFTYLVVNTMIMLVWAFTGGGFFWPIFVIAFWGIGVVLQAYVVYGGGRMTETQIQREMNKLG